MEQFPTIGFSYSYLNPDNLQLPEAYVRDGVLAPARQAFKALVVGNTELLTVAGATRIAEIATEGLPVIFYGGVPTSLVGFNASGAAYVKAALESILELPNVHVTGAESLSWIRGGLGHQTADHGPRQLNMVYVLEEGRCERMRLCVRVQ